MHVLITTDAVGGVWVYTRELVTGLLQRKHSVTLVSIGEAPRPTQMKWIQELPNVDFRVAPFPLEWMQDAPKYIEQSIDFISSLVEKLNPDVLHFNQFCYGMLECSAPRIVVAHSDVLSWWVAVHGALPDNNRWLEWYQGLVSKGICGADVVVAPSQWMLDALCEHYPKPEHMQVIYNGRAPELFDHQRTKTNCVLTVGRLWDLGKQAALLLQKPHAMPVYVVGPDCYPGSSTEGSLSQVSSQITFFGRAIRRYSEDDLRGIVHLRRHITL